MDYSRFYGRKEEEARFPAGLLSYVALISLVWVCAGGQAAGGVYFMMKETCPVECPRMFALLYRSVCYR
jgi:hypothetical protein